MTTTAFQPDYCQLTYTRLRRQGFEASTAMRRAREEKQSDRPCNPVYYGATRAEAARATAKAVVNTTGSRCSLNFAKGGRQIFEVGESCIRYIYTAAKHFTPIDGTTGFYADLYQD